jgi:hypothetical protein
VITACGSNASSSDDGGGAPNDATAPFDSSASDAPVDSSVDAPAATSSEASDAISPDANDAGQGDAGFSCPDGGDAGAIGTLLFGEQSSPSLAYFSGFFVCAPSSSNGCTLTNYGSCAATDCPLVLDGGLPTYPTAGTLTIRGGALGDAGLAVNPGPYGIYNYSQFTAMFGKGDALSVEASGGTVPAFPNEQVIAPGYVTVTAPVSDGGAYVIPTSQDLQVTWSGGESNASLGVVLSGVSGGHQKQVICTFDAQTGTGTVPQAALASLTNASSGQLYIEHLRTTGFDAGAFAVTLGAATLVGGSTSFP